MISIFPIIGNIIGVVFAIGAMALLPWAVGNAEAIDSAPVGSLIPGWVSFAPPIVLIGVSVLFFWIASVAEYRKSMVGYF
jgi:hypothetical protein